MRQMRVLLTVGICFLAGAVSSWGYDEPQVNLGFTSFLDGAPPSGPGWYFTEYLQYYTADKLADANGDRLKLPTSKGLKDAKLDDWVSLNQIIYQSNQPILLGGKWGMDVIVPVVWLDFEPKGAPLSDNGVGIGDVLVGPYIQWDPIIVNDKPLFMHRVELQCIVPSGRYDKDEALNPGSNFFSFDPYWAGTLFLTPKWSMSWRAHYLWNDKNSDPQTALYPGAKDSQAGDAFHMNFATEYEVIEKRLRLGINGYYLKQITDTQMDGHDISNKTVMGKEEVVGVGPGVVWHISPNDHLLVNAYVEMGAVNRSEGQRYTLRWVHHF